MKAAGEASAGAALLDSDRLRALVLVCVAAVPAGVRKAEVKDDLLPLTAHRLSPPQGAAMIERELEALVRAGLVGGTRGRLAASAAGRSQAAIFLGVKGEHAGFLPEGSDAVMAEVLAKALGLEREARRSKALATLDGLRLAIVQHAFAVKIKGVATPARLRAALAAIALERAFGNQLTAGKLGLSPKAGRVLAGQLAEKPRDHGTDKRLIAALAADRVGCARADYATLRLRVLQRYLERAARPQQARDGAHPRRVEPTALGARRPDLGGFASEVRAHAASSAQGWAGNRKAYISHVWRLMRERRPEWGLSEIEFKCMLAEAHRAGQVLLANADLKDASNLRDVQDSALVYKNAVFHFVRVDV
jgi:hypothetical protein